MYLAETISRVPKKGVTPLGIHIAGQRKVGFFLLRFLFMLDMFLIQPTPPHEVMVLRPQRSAATCARDGSK